MVRCHAIDNDSGGSHPCHATGGVCEAARGRERQKHEELFLETLSRVTFLWLLHLRLWDCKGAASYRESRWQTLRQRSLISWAESSTLFRKKMQPVLNPQWRYNSQSWHAYSPAASTPAPPALAGANLPPCWIHGFPLDIILKTNTTRPICKPTTSRPSQNWLKKAKILRQRKTTEM